MPHKSVLVYTVALIECSGPADNTPFQTTLLTTITWGWFQCATDSDTCVLVDRLVQDNGAIMTYTTTG